MDIFVIGMTSYWILIVKDHQYQGRRIPALEVLRNRVENRFWSLSKRAPNIKRIREGDKVVFYVASSEVKGFAGTGVVASNPHPMTPEQKFHAFGTPSEAFDYSIELENPVLWPEVKEVEPLIGKLSFIKSKRRWGSAFRGGIKRITEEDYNIIVKA